MIIVKKIVVNWLADNWEVMMVLCVLITAYTLSFIFVMVGLFWGVEIEQDNTIFEESVSSVAVVNSIGGCPSIGKVSVNAVYGYSRGYFGGSRFHNGIDLNFVFSDVYSITSGVVVFAGWDVMGGGNMMIVRSGDMDVWYAHLSMFTARVGQRVKVGDRLGISGNSGGLSTGAHLHLSIKLSGRFVNPYLYIMGCVR